MIAMIDGYAALKDFVVPLSIGLMGFGGVAFTIYYNAKLAREQLSSETAHAARSTRAALIVELESNLKTFQHDIQTAHLGEAGILIPASTKTAMFDAHVNRLGLLELDEVRAVLEAYERLKEHPQRATLAVLLETGQEPERLQGFFKIPPAAIAVLTRLWKKNVDTLKTAIHALSQH